MGEITKKKINVQLYGDLTNQKIYFWLAFKKRIKQKIKILNDNWRVKIFTMFCKKRIILMGFVYEGQLFLEKGIFFSKKLDGNA